MRYLVMIFYFAFGSANPLADRRSVAGPSRRTRSIWAEMTNGIAQMVNRFGNKPLAVGIDVDRTGLWEKALTDGGTMPFDCYDITPVPLETLLDDIGDGPSVYNKEDGTIRFGKDGKPLNFGEDDNVDVEPILSKFGTSTPYPSLTALLRDFHSGKIQVRLNDLLKIIRKEVLIISHLHNVALQNDLELLYDIIAISRRRPELVDGADVEDIIRNDPLSPTSVKLLKDIFSHTSRHTMQVIAKDLDEIRLTRQELMARDKLLMSYIAGRLPEREMDKINFSLRDIREENSKWLISPSIKTIVNEYLNKTDNSYKIPGMEM